MFAWVNILNKAIVATFENFTIKGQQRRILKYVQHKSTTQAKTAVAA